MFVKREKPINIHAIVHEVADNGYHFFRNENEGRVNDDGCVNVNLSDVFTELIKQAARCNRFSSDVIYDIDAINYRLEHFNINDESSFEPFVLGFRKDGVDSNQFVLCRTQNASEGYSHAIIFPQDYFAVFTVEFRKCDEWADLGYIQIITTGRYV